MSGYKYTYRAECKCGWKSRKYRDPNAGRSAEQSHECPRHYLAVLIEYRKETNGQTTYIYV